MATPIYCLNSSSLKSSDMFLMINALNMMLPAFCNSWSVKQYICIAVPSNIKPKNATYCVFLDNNNSPGSLGYHTEFGNIPYGEVFVKTILQYGGTTFMNGKAPSISQAFSHEIFEIIVNQNINIWWQRSDGSLVPAEVCDPVQANIIPIKVGNVVVGISDYILPEWNDPQSTKGPYNFLNTLIRPFQIAKGGYAIVMKNNVMSYVFGKSVTPYIEYRAANVLNYFETHGPTISTDMISTASITDTVTDTVPAVPAVITVPAVPAVITVPAVPAVPAL